MTTLNYACYSTLVSLAILYCQGVHFFRYGFDSYTPKYSKRVVSLFRFVGLALVLYYGYRTTWHISLFTLTICLLFHLMLRRYFTDLYEWNVIQRRDPATRSPTSVLGARQGTYDAKYHISGLYILLVSLIALYFFIRHWPGGTFVQLLYTSLGILGLSITLLWTQLGCRHKKHYR